jgi:5'-3' exonuclease
MSTQLLIDADFFAYQACAAAETEADYSNDVIVVTSNFSEAVRIFQQSLDRIKEFIDFSDQDNPDETILFFSSSTNFRKAIDPSYKGHRNRKKPCGYKRLINHFSDLYETIIVPDLEADDAIGIFATNPVHETAPLIVSPDKDMKQIPDSLLWDGKAAYVNYTMKDQADLWFFMQVLSGDQTDGYSGVPGIGLKRAAALLESKGCTWDTVLNAFLDADLTKEDALRNARLARILRYSDYDHEADCYIPWTPSCPSDGADDGTEVHSSEDQTGGEASDS